MFITKRAGLERGDTLVEVLVALSVFGIILVGTFALMNKGMAQMYDTMERSEVRLLLNRQTEMLTYARDMHMQQLGGSVLTAPHDTAAATLWNTIKGLPSVGGAPNMSSCGNGNNTTSNAFAVTTAANGSLTHITNANIRAQASAVPAPGDGLWIQKVRSGSGNPVPYTDFYIRACWQQNSSPVTQVISTVVRLYDN